MNKIWRPSSGPNAAENPLKVMLNTVSPDIRNRPAAVALLPAVRSRQWVRNLLADAIQLAAGRLRERAVLVDTLAAFLCCCGAVSAT
jgi:hypothetical protein